MAFSLKDYSDLQELRIGGMGKIFSATQISLNRRVVIKEMTPNAGDPAQNKRFENEAKSAAALDHENIIKVYDFGIESNKFYIVMEYVDGADLDELLSTPTFPKEVALMIIFQALKGIHYSHQHNIIHRDIKPGNILISKTGTVKVADFGLAYAASSPSKLTQTGAVVGTPHFMAPEQISGKPIKDNRVDLWAVGVLLYKALSGEYPFIGDNLPALCYNIINTHQKDIRKFVPALPDYLATRISDCLEKDPEKRATSLIPLIKGLQEFFFSIGVRDVPIEIQQYLALPARYYRKSLLDKRTIYTNIRAFGSPARMYALIFGVAVITGLGLFFYLGKKGDIPENRAESAQTVSTIQKAIDTTEKAVSDIQSGRNSAEDIPAKSSASQNSHELKATTSKGKKESAIKPSVQDTKVQANKSAQPSRVILADSSSPAAHVQTDSGMVKISVEPGQSEIIIDEKDKLPWQNGKPQALPTGKHHMRVQAGGYITREQDFTVAVNGNHEFSIALTAAAIGTGIVEIQSFPPAEIYIDGSMKAKTPLANALSLPAGKHSLILKSAGYKDHEELIEVKNSGIKRMKIRLEKE